MLLLPFLTSAPGKVIIFGEHSAVYNRPAVAASVSALRAYLLVEAADSPGAVELDFPDIAFSHSWCNLGAVVGPVEPTTHAALDPQLTAALEPLLEPLQGSLQYHAAFCFLYLYACLCPGRTGVRFCIKSTLPIGAGLGSSAAISVALALAMLRLGGHISGTQLDSSAKDLVNKWSFLGEKCIHGTPSGIDNAVATYGRAVSFCKSENGSTSFDVIPHFPTVPMVLTYTRIPRSTKTLVAHVRGLVEQEPTILNPLLDSMAALATRGIELLQSDLDAEKHRKLQELVRLNHGLLVGLGVSHPGLEAVRSLSDEMNVGSTKLTGAGGGGCSLTILNQDITRDQIELFKDTLASRYQYETFETDLGGIGCSLLPHDKTTQWESIGQLFHSDKVGRRDIDELLKPDSQKLSWIY